ncbi:MAG: (Fe-S)-binding protein [Armatimonadota bacterium]|nr:(Fe-S)-binding protein [Armatimonadota bacterium]
MPRVALFVTCLVDQLFPQVGEAAARVLERAGCDVVFPEGQTCCGQAVFNDGFRDEARALARRHLDMFAAADAVVAPSGSCAAMVREWYPRLFRDEPAQRARAEDLAGHTYELSEYLVRVRGVADLGARFDAAVAYHPTCHGLRGLGLREEPLRLLRAVRGLRLVPLGGAEECCGFGGFFSITFATLSSAMLATKLDALEASGADVVTATDASCLMHIAGGLERRRSRVRAMHLAEVLAGGAGP